MPAFLVHGVPETHHLWDPLRSRLSRKDVIAIDLPGFGAAVPAGFTATKEAYVDWLIARLEQVGEPVDLVAHDWGCMLAARVASLRPDLIRTWAGGGGSVYAEHEWHPLAKIWQTPGEGEAYFEKIDRVAIVDRWVQGGMSREHAVPTADRIDQRMGSCILRLYRSALHVGREWQPGLAAVTAPGLIFHGVRDHAAPQAAAEQLYADMHARCLILLDAGHWFPVEKPDEMAAALEEHWAR